MKYIPATPAEREHMLRVTGVRAVDDLFADIPREVRLRGPLDLPPAMSDPELLAHARRLAGRNTDCDQLACFLGAGAYDHFIPSTVPHLALKPEFLTAYTPYQAEIMQGELQAIFEYQSLMCELTAMDVANASMYDGASATGEAASMAADLTKRLEFHQHRSRPFDPSEHRGAGGPLAAFIEKQRRRVPYFAQAGVADRGSPH